MPSWTFFEGRDSYEDIRFVFMLLASEKAQNYLSFLAALARSFRQFSHGPTLDGQDKKEFKAAVRNAFAETDDRPARRRTKFNKLLTDEAAKIAKAAVFNHTCFYGCFPPPSTPYDFSKL